MVEDGKKVSAYNTKSFVFMREKSVGDPAVDNITTVNIPAWVSGQPRGLGQGGNRKSLNGGFCVVPFFVPVCRLL